ncbi:uridylate-specific endoribonuclease B-like [Haliotis cracherodii]|uniref:uridylate-specific endoribonuclease B-like n=1 Tax=Haliotis cracherodii TaxID=6455 RepID=UPI0039EB14AC
MELTCVYCLCLLAATLGPAVAASCSGRCNAGDVGDCFCNNRCRRHGDCCHDYQDACTTQISKRIATPPTSGSCSGRCTVGRVGTCFCNDQCRRHGDCCHDYVDVCSSGVVPEATPNSRSLVTMRSNATLTEVVAGLWASDVNRLPLSEFSLNFQNHTTTRDTSDRAVYPLFNNISHEFFNRNTYRLFINLLDNYDPNVRVLETLTASERHETEAFLDGVVATDTMSFLRHYLAQQGVIQDTTIDLRNLLKTLWFDLYPRRSRGVVSSSGFEHVMVGELRGSRVTGFHNWIQFYLEEQQGRLSYEGYVTKLEPYILGARFTWKGGRKQVGSMFVGVSPEFDMAVYTLCIAIHPGGVCQFNFRGHNITIKTYDNANVQGLQVATAFIRM